MNVPLGDDRSINISPTTLNHWATVALGLIVAFVVYSYQQQQSQIGELRNSLGDHMSQVGTLMAEWKAHEDDDHRQNDTLDAIGKKQIEVLSRLSAIETHDTQTASTFAHIDAELRDIEHDLTEIRASVLRNTQDIAPSPKRSP